MPSPSEAERVITPQMLRDWPLPNPQGSKEARGTVLVVGGSRFTPGAVLLAGVGALRAGAGRLQLAVESSTAAALSIAVPEAKVIGLPENNDELASMTAEADVLLVGPGLGDIAETAELLHQALDTAGKDAAMVLDAYALGALSKEPDLLAGRPQGFVLTPNVVEAGHLLGRDAEDDLAAEARTLAERYHATVSLYGHIATPDGQAWREESGDAGLGTSGSGDVRAGIVAGLLGRGAEPAQAACWGAFAHAVSGQRLAPRYGRTGFLARELVDEVASTIATV
jgi:ADP-dependent NAD(P)H-hydrate dehydratase